MVFKLILFFSVKRWFIRFYSYHLCRVACHTSLTESCQKVVFLYVVLIPMIVLYILWLLSFKRWFFVSLTFHPLFTFMYLSTILSTTYLYIFLFYLSKGGFTAPIFIFLLSFPCHKVVLPLSKSGFKLFKKWQFSCHKVVVFLS